MMILSVFLQKVSSANDVANQFNVDRSTITSLMIRLRQTGSTTDRPRSGRPRVTTERQDRHIRFIQLKNRFVNDVSTARKTYKRTNNRVSYQTIRLLSVGLRARRPVKGPNSESPA